MLSPFSSVLTPGCSWNTGLNALWLIIRLFFNDTFQIYI